METLNTLPLQAIVPIELDGQRLDRALSLLFSDYSRSCLQTCVRQQQVLVDTKVASRTRDRVQTGQRICLTPPAMHTPTRWEAQPIQLEIIYEDDDLLIINKPAGLVVHPAAGHPDQTLVNALLHHAPALSELPRAGLVHRLDRETSGLLAVAKTRVAHTALVRQLEERQMQRRYLAVVQGRLITGGHIDLPIGRHPILRQKQAVTPINSKTAITDYRVIERFRQHTRLQIQLTTGRTHQIRVHMAHLRYPVIGDPLYGGRLQIPAPAFKGCEASAALIQRLRQLKRQALHAHTLGFTHPVTQTYHTWEAPIPQDIQQLLDCLRADHAQVPSF